MRQQSKAAILFLFSTIISVIIWITYIIYSVDNWKSSSTNDEYNYILLLLGLIPLLFCIGLFSVYFCVICKHRYRASNQIIITGHPQPSYESYDFTKGYQHSPYHVKTTGQAYEIIS